MMQALPECPYGANCYRKNPAHFQEFSHSSQSESKKRSSSPANDEDGNDSNKRAKSDLPLFGFHLNYIKKLGKAANMGALSIADIVNGDITRAVRFNFWFKWIGCWVNARC